MMRKESDDNLLECSTFVVAFIVGTNVTYAIGIDSSFEFDDSSKNPSFLLVDKKISSLCQTIVPITLLLPHL